MLCGYAIKLISPTLKYLWMDSFTVMFSLSGDPVAAALFLSLYHVRRRVEPEIPPQRCKRRRGRLSNRLAKFFRANTGAGLDRRPKKM